MGVQTQVNSVAMATYQGMPYLSKQLASILSQMNAEDEIVISDNGSTDGTYEFLLARAEEDKRICLFLYTDIRGVQANFQNALSHCSGEIIYLADQDDIWLPNRVQTIHTLFCSDLELLAVQTDASVMDQDGTITEESFFRYRNCGAGVCKNIWKNTWQGCSMAFRKEILSAALPFPARIPMHDMWIGLLCELAGSVIFYPDILLLYRRHDRNVSPFTPSHFSQRLVWRLTIVFQNVRHIPSILRVRKLLKHRSF